MYQLHTDCITYSTTFSLTICWIPTTIQEQVSELQGKFQCFSAVSQYFAGVHFPPNTRKLHRTQCHYVVLSHRRHTCYKLPVLQYKQLLLLIQTMILTMFNTSCCQSTMKYLIGQLNDQLSKFKPVNRTSESNLFQKLILGHFYTF